MLPIVMVLVRMHRERLVVDDLAQPPVGLVVEAHPAFFLHDFTLRLEDILVDAQRRHAVGLEPQHERQILRRGGLPEDGGILGRVRVALSANARNRGRMSLGLHVLRSLEHHVLEQMRETGAARLFVLRADVIPDFGGGRSASNDLRGRRPAARSAASSSCSRACWGGSRPAPAVPRRAARRARIAYFMDFSIMAYRGGTRRDAAACAATGLQPSSETGRMVEAWSKLGRSWVEARSKLGRS